MSEWKEYKLSDVLNVKHGYPPDLEVKATETVLEQANLMAGSLSH